MSNEKLPNEKSYDHLKNIILDIVKETPNDMSLGVKIRLFAESLKNDVILNPSQLERKTI